MSDQLKVSSEFLNNFGHHNILMEPNSSYVVMRQFPIFEQPFLSYRAFLDVSIFVWFKMESENSPQSPVQIPVSYWSKIVRSKKKLDQNSFASKIALRIPSYTSYLYQNLKKKQKHLKLKGLLPWWVHFLTSLNIFPKTNIATKLLFLILMKLKRFLLCFFWPFS